MFASSYGSGMYVMLSIVEAEDQSVAVTCCSAATAEVPEKVKDNSIFTKKSNCKHRAYKSLA